VWTYDNTWYWGSGNCDVDGHAFGFNIGYGFGNTKAASENVIFYGGVAHKIDDVTFVIPEDDYCKPWKFTSSDGRFEMDFMPLLDRSACLDYKLIVSDQHQVFGIHGADRKEYGRHQSQIDALGRHRYAMDVASGDQEEYACYGQHHRQQFTPGRKFSISEGYPENHHGRTGILDHCGSGCISCRNGGKVGIMHEHETHNAIEYKLQKEHRFLSYGLYARLPLPLHHGYQEHDDAC